MAYSAITNGEIDTDSPITTALMTKYRDNIDAMRDGTGINDDTILQRHIAAGAIHQGELDTGGPEEDSTTGSASFLTSAGQYGFSHQVKGNSTSDWTSLSGVSNEVATLGTYGHYVYLVVDGSGTAYSQIRYVNASAPFDLGDGEIPLFAWILLDSNGNIESISTSDAPPWAYNGPTIITPDRVGVVGGNLKKFRNIKTIDEDTGDITVKEKEIDMSMKNSDIDVFPHPFIANDLTNKSVVILDPPDTLYLKELREAGQSVNELLHEDYLRLDNAPINRSVPNGVLPSKFKWKNSRSRAGEMMKDKKRRGNRGDRQ